MTFKMRLPRDVPGSSMARWEEIELSEDEEAIIDEKAREQNIELLKECIDDARRIMKERGLKAFETNVTRLSIALFDKRASHVVYHKERRAKDKFERLQAKKQ